VVLALDLYGDSMLSAVKRFFSASGKIKEKKRRNEGRCLEETALVAFFVPYGGAFSGCYLLSFTDGFVTDGADKVAFLLDSD